MSSGFYYLGANVPGKKLELVLLGGTVPLWTGSAEGDVAGLPAPTLEVQSPLTPRQMGYTGNTCSNCESTRMQVAGHCEVCLDCGTTTGCS